MKTVLMALAVAVAVLPLAAGAQHASGPNDFMTTMDKMHKSMPKPTGDIDRDFAAMMIVHHQGAIDMAQIELQHGKNAALKKMAKKMISDQTAEIKQLQKHVAK